MTPDGPSADRLGRLLNLVPYLLARPGVADRRGGRRPRRRPSAQLREDLELLWVCGLPGYGPGDLIDMAFDGDRVTITYDAGIDRPLRLNPDEATALVVALRMLAETPGIAHRDAIQRALAKIENAAGEYADAPGRGAARRATTTAWQRFGGAVERGRALRITYYTATRDETTERVVDPMRVVVVAGRSYLEAWCRRAEARAAVPGRPHRRPDRAGRGRPRRRRRPSRTDVDERRLPARPGPAADHPAGRAAAPAGSPSTTRGAGRRGSRRRSGWSRCASPTSTGPAGSCSASARVWRFSHRPNSPTASVLRSSKRLPRTANPSAPLIMNLGLWFAVCRTPQHHDQQRWAG